MSTLDREKTPLSEISVNWGRSEMRCAESIYCLQRMLYLCVNE